MAARFYSETGSPVHYFNHTAWPLQAHADNLNVLAIWLPFVRHGTVMGGDSGWAEEAHRYAGGL